MQERTSRNLKIAGLVAVLPTAWLVVVGIIVTKHHYDYLRYYVDRDAADRFAGHIVVGILLLIAATIVALGITAATAVHRRVVRSNQAFEASIATLPLLEQVQARRERQMKQAGLVLVGTAAAAYGLHRWDEHMEQSVRETRERNDRVNELLEEHRRSM
jgi:uncharacterized membrane protein